jgi:hypothetical protein
MPTSWLHVVERFLRVTLMRLPTTVRPWVTITSPVQLHGPGVLVTVAVELGTVVFVGGAGVLVRVGGTGVLVRVGGMGVPVGGTGVLIVGTGVLVRVGGTGVGGT